MEIKFDHKKKKKNSKDDSNLFGQNLFPNLENLSLTWDTNITSSNYRDLDVRQFKNMKNLKVLSLRGFSLHCIDVEFNYLTEATFSIKVPENICNFYNLEKLCLENFTDKISLDEKFLEHLVNLEELKLDDVFDSIDEDVQYLFKSLVKLKKLTLTYNEINTVKSSYFQHLVDLEELNLRLNDIRAIEQGAFKTLTKLKYLNFSCNEIKEFQKDCFASNAQLEKNCVRTINR